MTLKPDIKVRWDHGTAYDFLSSLHVLHFPDEFGLRGAWAAGVRSRLPNEVRDFLEVVIGNFNIPLAWINSLPEPKDAATALVALKHIPRWLAGNTAPQPGGFRGMPGAAAEDHRARHLESGNPGRADVDLAASRQGAARDPGPVNEKRAGEILNLYAAPAKFGGQYLDALETYYKVFFSEEEKRIAPKLKQALEKDQKIKAEQGTSTT